MYQRENRSNAVKRKWERVDKLEQVIKDVELGLRIAKATDCGLFKTSVKSAEQILELLKEKQPKKGHWKENDDQNFQCSECGNESFLTFDDVFVYGMKLQKFCSNCGADMREDGEPK